MLDGQVRIHLAPSNVASLRHLCQLGDAAGEFAKDGFLPGPEFGGINGWFGKGDAAEFGFPGGSDRVRRMQLEFDKAVPPEDDEQGVLFG